MKEHKDKFGSETKNNMTFNWMRCAGDGEIFGSLEINGKQVESGFYRTKDTEVASYIAFKNGTKLTITKE